MFETKDSGGRQHFASGMQRDLQEGKTLWHLTRSGPMYKRWAELLTRGAEKYDADNWLKADSEDEKKRFLASAVRHFEQWLAGDRDEDHAAAVFFNINGYEYVRERLSAADSVSDTNGGRTPVPGEVVVVERRVAARVPHAHSVDGPMHMHDQPHNGGTEKYLW